MDNKRIFTFWEPRKNLHGYLYLCMKTWKKFLPDYEIILLDYSNLEQWLGKDFFDAHLYKNFDLMRQADAIRCAVLKKHGGVWFDTDTIVTSEKIREILEIDSEFVLINHHIGFIVAKENASILNAWEKGIFKNIKLHKKFFGLKKYFYLKAQFSSIFSRQSSVVRKNKIKSFYSRFKQWDFLGNSLLRKALSVEDEKIFHSVDGANMNALPEVNWASDNVVDVSAAENYRNFYFRNDYSEYVLTTTKGLICLHNSWTPKKFKKMSEEEFLAQDTTLANIFKKLDTLEG